MPTPAVEFANLTARYRARYGERFDASELHPDLARWYQVRQRVRVTRTYPNGDTRVRTGRIGATTGHRPAFLLIHRAGDHSSSDVLSAADRVTGVQTRPGGPYRPIKES